MKEGRAQSLYTIPSGVPFAAALAQALLEEVGDDRLALADYRILLPTRRACRTVRDAFLRQSGGRPLILPRLQPLGDVDEEELLLEAADPVLAARILELPPAMPPLRRRILLARAIMNLKDFASGPDQALALAGDLGRLMDQVHTENLDFARLPALVEGDLARHWAVTTAFLEILSVHWPNILKEQGCIDAADRRNRLILALAEHWQAQPPSMPVIAAGSTGSIPATARLLQVIAGLPQGRVVLPGLDQDMDADSWQALDDTHPQATLRRLLAAMAIDRADVCLWPVADTDGARAVLAGEMMRPAATSEQWRTLAHNVTRAGSIRQAAAGLERYDCDTPEEEARVIAMILRHTLEYPERTAALVTPDRTLARRVAMACRRWGIEIDDSGGQSLYDSPVGLFMRLTVQAVREQMAPGALLALLRHGLCRAGMMHTALEGQASRLETALLRGPKPPPGFDGLRNHAAQVIEQRPQRQRTVEACMPLVERLDEILSPLIRLADGEAHAFHDWLRVHITCAEALAAGPDQSGADSLWRGEDGEEAARFFAALAGESAGLPPVSVADYLSIIEQLMKNITVRPAYGTHPRLYILGQLEARLIDADTMILGGLNEGSWPPDPGHDPWMSRPMRRDFGLPSPEQSVGLAAHDFVQAFCHRRVVLTRALRKDGAPTVPARWLQRLDTVLQAAGVDPKILSGGDMPWIALARSIDRSAAIVPCRRPAPIPPLAARPVKLPVTQIEHWQRDPYGVYARYILRLRKLDPLERPPDAAARGTFLHDVMHEFIRTCPDRLPPDAVEMLKDIGMRAYRTMQGDEAFWRYWLPRFERIADWVVGVEREWRRSARPYKTEIDGEMAIAAPALPGGRFTLTARADRIDRTFDGMAAIIDYKSGGSFKKSGILSGDTPQLPLEALIVNAGGFSAIDCRATAYLGYWKLTGGPEEGDIVAIDDNDKIRMALERAEEGLHGLITHFSDPASAYICLPDPDRAPRFNDYAHLARVQEWAVLDDQAEATA